MKTVIIYASVHHNNTKELVCAIAAENDIDVVDATKITEKDLSGYDLIGFASGIYFGKLHQSVINFAEVNLPENKDVFLICTYGGKPVFDSIKKIIKKSREELWENFLVRDLTHLDHSNLLEAYQKDIRIRMIWIMQRLFSKSWKRESDLKVSSCILYILMHKKTETLPTESLQRFV